MRKITVLLVLLVSCVFALFADDFQGAEIQEEQNISYSYTSFGMGYGLTYTKFGEKSELLHNIDFAVDYGFVAMTSSSKLGFGFGGRTDILYAPLDQRDASLSIHTMVGPEFVIPLSRFLNLDILVGPVFSLITFNGYEKQESFTALGPAADISVEILFPSFSGISMRAGVTAYGSFGFEKGATGVSVIPYASITLKFGPESLYPVYYSPIYYYPIYYPYYIL